MLSLQHSSKLAIALVETFGELPAGARLILCVSGGVDSVCLAHFCLGLKREGRLDGIEFSIAHVNHALRGEESDGDEHFVRAIADDYGVPFLHTRLSWEDGEKPSQAACREKRMHFLRSLLTSEADRLVLAHHRDDQIETLFLRLLRGTGAQGLRLMQKSSGPLLRPWLTAGRDEIERAAAELGMKWREDSSNRSSKYERNWLRNEIFPLLEERRPGFGLRLLALAREVSSSPRESHIVEPLGDWGGMLFYSLEALRAADDLSLRNGFRLNRRDTRKAAEFFQVGQGMLTSPDALFWSSQGLVLYARGFSPEGAERLIRDSIELQESGASSLLGKWLVVPFDGELAPTGGQRELVKRKIPAFLRGGIPFARKEKESIALCPRHFRAPHEFKRRCVQFRYDPSALARALLNDWKG